MNKARRLLAASVISVQNSCFIYPACQSCFSRLVLNPKRFNCPKCGCTGEVKDAGYRYRLSLKIADTNDLFDITVFGSCLDPFFGVTAGNLQRCIEDFNQLSGETNRDASPRVLVEAVESCFIGKRFIFGVKGCASEDGGCSFASSILQNCSRINRGTKTLTACQIFLPNAAVTGFTVITYFHRLLQSRKFGNHNNSSHLPDSLSPPIDEPVGELSSLSSWNRNSCFVQSSGGESFLGCWQQSFSLTSSVAWVTAEDFPTLEVGKLVSEQHEEEGRPVSAESCSVSLNNQTLWESQCCSSSVREENKEEEDELNSQPSQTDRISATDKLERISFSGTNCSPPNNSRLLKNPSEFGVKSIYPKTSIGNDSYKEKSPNSLFYNRRTSTSNHVNVTRVSQTDSVLWEELPFSESLNEFLARIEGESFVTPPSLDAGQRTALESSKLSVNLNKSCPRQAPGAGGLPEGSISGRFLPPAEKDSWESISFAWQQSNPNSVSDEVSQHESFCSISSSADKERGASCVIPSSHLLTPSQSLLVTSEYSASKRNRQPKEADTEVSKSACPFINLQRAAEREESFCLQRSKRATCMQSVRDSCLAGSGNKENCSYEANQRKDLTFTGIRNSDPATPNNTRRMCERELKTSTELQENAFKSINKREMIQNSSCPEGSYNASADLFDTSEVAKTVEFLNKSCNSLIQEGRLTGKVTTPELGLFPLDVHCNSLKQTPSLHRSPLAFRKHSTPVAYSFYDSECNSVSAQDFVPYSESTPVAKPVQKLWPLGEQSSLVTLFTPKNPVKVHSKCKRSRSSFQNTLLQQLTGKLVKRQKLCNGEEKESNSSVPQLFQNSQLPADFEEWIPISGSKENSEKDACFRSEGLNSENTAGILATPVSAGTTKALFLNDSILETCSSSEGKNHLSRANYSGVILEGATGWSPELFFQAQSPFFCKPKQ